MSLLSYGVLPKEVPRKKDDEDPSSPDGSPLITEKKSRSTKKNRSTKRRRGDDEPKKSRSTKKNRSTKRRRGDDQPGEASRIEQEEKEMKRLESFLFGNLYSPVEFGKEIGNHDHQNDGAVLYSFDRSPGDEVGAYEEDITNLFGGQSKEERKPVWVDEEEERTEVDLLAVSRLRKLRKEVGEKVISGVDYVSRLRAQHAKMNPRTEWAEITQEGTGLGSLGEDSDDESGITAAHGFGDFDGVDVLRSNYELVEKSNVKLLPGLLEYTRMMDANSEEPSNGPINSVEFHRNGQLLLTAGLDRRLRFFQVDGKRNTIVQSIFVEDCPMRKASFLPDGSQVILSGRRKFFYVFDLIKAAVDKVGPLTGREEKSLELFEVSPDANTIAFVGNEGYIHLVSSKTKELIGSVKMNGTACSLAFADDGRQLLSSGGDGHIYHWDLRTRRCIHKGVDEGCIASSALCTSHDSSMFAAGSSSGIVNVYKREDFLGGKKKPLKTVENLTTSVHFMKFNHDAQILAICSHMKKDSLKLIHIPSFNVFSNWPPRYGLRYPRCLDYSPGGGFMAIGNAAGKVLLFKLNHYKSA